MKDNKEKPGEEQPIVTPDEDSIFSANPSTFAPEEEKDLNYDVVSPDDEVSIAKKKGPKRTFLDFNFSWIMLLVDIAVILGVGTFNLQTSPIGSFNPTLYIFLVVLLTALANFVAYALGKVIGGLAGGYQLRKMTFLGFTFIFPDEKGKKTKVKFRLSTILDLRLTMVPNAKKKPNHYLYLLGGMMGYLTLTAVVLVVAFAIAAPKGWLYYSLLYGLAYGFLIPLYELFPCRLDYPNDCFILIKTQSASDCAAYNLELSNTSHLLLNQDFENCEFADYNSFYRSHILYYNYLEKLYDNELDEAVELLSKMQYYRVYFTEEAYNRVVAEKMFLLLYSESYEDAERVFADLNHDSKHALESMKELSIFRSSLLIAALISNSLEDTQGVISDYLDYLESSEGDSSKRLSKEKELFELSFKKAAAAHPEWNLTLSK